MGWQDDPIVGAPSAQPQASRSWRDDPIIGATQAPAEKTLSSKARDFVSGEPRLEFPDLPNIDQLKTPFFDSGSWRAAAGLIAATDNDQKLDILKKSFPDAAFSADKFGNPIMQLGEQRVYVNKPGMRAQDAIQLGGQAALFTAAARVLPKAGALLAKAPGFRTAGTVAEALPAPLKAAASAAGGSVAIDEGAHALGAEKQFDAERAGTNAVVGGAAQLFSPLANKAWNVIRNIFREAPVTAAGDLLPEATVVLERAGIDPTQVSAEFKQHFSRLAQDAADPKDAAIAAQAQSLPQPVPLTRGNVTGLPSDQMTESMAAKGAYGRDAELTMRGVQSQQQEALRGNVDAIRGQMGGQVLERGQGGAQAQQALVEAQRRTKRATGAAYDAAEGARALVRTEGIQPLVKSIGESIESYASQAPGAKEKLNELARLATGEHDAATVKALFDWRRRTSELSRAAPNATEGAALSRMLKAFDNGIEDTVKSALMAGDDEAAKRWLKAIGIRRGEARRFQGDDLISDLLEKERAGGRVRLKVAPEQAANYIFGASDLGFIGKPELTRELVRMRGRLGEGSDAWRALKEEAFLRFSNAGEGAAQGASRDFSGVKFKKAWDSAWFKNGPTMRVLFTEKERRLIDEFAMVAARVTGKVAGGDNPSGTGLAIANAVQKMAAMPFLGEKAQLLLRPVMGAAVKWNAARKVGNAIAEPVKRRQLPPGVFPGTATAAGNLIQAGDR